MGLRGRDDRWVEMGGEGERWMRVGVEEWEKGRALPGLMESADSEMASCLEADLAMSEEDESPIEDHWPELPSRNPPPLSSVTPQLRLQPSTSSTSTKRPVDASSDSLQDSDGVDCLPPAAKIAKGASAMHDVPSLPQHGVSSLYTNSLPSSNLPAFAPRNAYVKLSFSGNPSTDTKLRWLSDVNRAFQQQRELAEVKMAAVTSRFVYISRKRQDIIDRVKAGEFLSLPLILEDSPERPRKFPSYILTRFPIDVDPKLAKGYPGVYFAHRFFQDGSPISRIVVVWSQPDPPPNEISFDFLPCLPPCEVRKLHKDQPWCYRCWGVGHISRYCSARPKCAWCAADHDSKTCPVRGEPSRPAASTSEPSPPEDTSRWKCPRCLQPGVNVWHGCTRRQVQARVTTIAPPPPPPPPPPPQSAPPTSPASPPDMALRKSVATLMARCTALENRFSALEARIDGLVAAQAANDSKLSTLVEAQQAIISTVTTLTEKMDTVASRLEKLFESVPSPGPSSSPGRSSAPTHRTSTSKYRVR
ncbi:hypothetical protein Pcinc_010266 [Petrolisthes cinctipes]|uniref:CCHC-type domain-containing protein n=1 Tax=Petrolisthes cinctipes TaxID=88211 RepID=A0AAE1G3P1_PETCI|nr:hypothetical protein Pcinc_010266 [Petrolisthes cinctipes]